MNVLFERFRAVLGVQHVASLLLVVGYFWGWYRLFLLVFGQHAKLRAILASQLVGCAGIFVTLQIQSAIWKISDGPAAALSLLVLVIGELLFRQDVSKQQARARLQARLATRDHDNDAPSIKLPDETSRAEVSAFTWLKYVVPVLMVSAVGWLYVVRIWQGLQMPVEIFTDGPIYHLYLAIRWWQDGQIRFVDTPFGELAAGYFPANGSLWMTWLITLGGDDQWAKVAQVPFTFWSVIALARIVHQLGGRLITACLLGCCWLALPFVITYSATPNVDTIYTSFFLAGLTFLIDYWRAMTQRLTSITQSATLATPSTNADDPFADAETLPASSVESKWILPLTIFLSGLGFGLAAGTKTVALPMLVIPVLTGFWLIWNSNSAKTSSHNISMPERAAPTNRLLLLSLYILGTVMGGGYWYARLCWYAGNPLYPLSVSILGIPILPGWYDASAMRQSSYHVPPSALALGLQMVLTFFTPVGILITLSGLLAGAVTLLTVRSETPEQRFRRVIIGLISAIVVWQITVYWMIVPYNTQWRFLTPTIGLMIVLATPILAWLQGESPDEQASEGTAQANTTSGPRLVSMVAGQVLVALLIGLLPWTVVATERGLQVVPAPISIKWSRHLPYLIAPTLVLVACWMILASGGISLLKKRRVRTRYLLGFVVSVITLIVFLPIASISSIQSRQSSYPNGFFPDHGFGSNLLPAWMHLPSKPSVVAYAGTNLPYYLHGPRLQHQVRYVPINRPAGFLLADYEREQRGKRARSTNPYPAWYREEPNREQWLKNLDELGITHLVVTRINYHGMLKGPPFPDFPVEKEWADSMPERFQLVDTSDYPQQLQPDGLGWSYLYRVKR